MSRNLIFAPRLSFSMDPIAGEYVLHAIESSAYVMKRLTTGKTFRVTHSKLTQVAAYVKAHGHVMARTNGATGISKTSGIEKTVAHALNLTRELKTWRPA